MTPQQCRMKALEALDVAAAAADPQGKSTWQAIAQKWLKLAAEAEPEKAATLVGDHVVGADAIPAVSPKMTPQQYRQKAREALDLANSIDDPGTEAAWEATANDWLEMALAAEHRLLRAATELAGKGPFKDGGSGTLQ